MSAPPSPSNLDELLDFIVDLVKADYADCGRCTNGAVIAHRIRLKYPGFEYAHLGLTRLADVVAEAEKRDLLWRNPDVQHLEVAPAGQRIVGAAGEPKAAVFRRVKPPVWNTFIRLDQPFSSFLNRRTGHVARMSLGSDASTFASPEDEQDWIRAAPIPVETQKQWIRDFLQDVPELPVDEAPLREDRWWDALIVWIRDRKPAAEIEWKRFRTRRVIGYLTHWAKQSGVEPDVLFEEPSPDARRRLTPRSQSGSEDAQLRQAILAALGDMPLPELTRLAIPAHYLLRHLKVR